MSIVAASDETYRKYGGENGELKLSCGFVQKFYMNDGNVDLPAVVQVMRTRDEKENNRDACMRLQLNDGSFSFQCVWMCNSLQTKLQSDGLKIHDIIGILGCKKIVASGKDSILITDYEILKNDVGALLGNPKKHSCQADDVEQYRNFKPSCDQCFKYLDDGETKVHPMETEISSRPRPPMPMRHTSDSGQHITPIRSITPYVNKWRICGMCTGREELKEITGRNGQQMKVFNFDLTDKDGDTIRIAGFGDSAQRAYSIVQKDCSYYVSNGNVKQANKRFNTTGHDYELGLRPESEITPCNDYIPKPAFHLRICPLEKITNYKDENIDVLAVVDKVEPFNEFTSRQGKPLVKRNVSLIDQSCTVVQLTLWGDQARNFDDNSVGQIIGIKGANVREWNGGFSLSLIGGSRLEMNPALNESPSLYEWYDSERAKVETKTIAAAGGDGAGGRDLRFLGTAIATQMGNEPELSAGRYMNIKGRIQTIKWETCLYQACASEKCNKKVVETNEKFVCEKCDITTDNFKWNYMVQCEIFDGTGSVWVTIFGNLAEKLFGKTASELAELKDRDASAYRRVVEDVCFKDHMFRIRAKPETYNDETRMRYSLYEIKEINYKSYITEVEKTLALLQEL